MKTFAVAVILLNKTERATFQGIECVHRAQAAISAGCSQRPLCAPGEGSSHRPALVSSPPLLQRASHSSDLSPFQPWHHQPIQTHPDASCLWRAFMFWQPQSGFREALTLTSLTNINAPYALHSHMLTLALRPWAISREGILFHSCCLAIAVIFLMTPTPLSPLPLWPIVVTLSHPLRTP